MQYTNEQLLEIGKQVIASGKCKKHHWQPVSKKELKCTECYTQKEVLLHSFPSKYYIK